MARPSPRTPIMAQQSAPGQEVMNVAALDHASWNCQKVADYFSQRGYPQYSDMWIKHDINGERVVLLAPQDIEKMGVAVVGHRLGIQKELRALKSVARQTSRNTVIATHYEAFDGSCFEKMFVTFCGCCPFERSQYILTASTLKIKEYHVSRCCRKRCPCLGGEWRSDNVNLMKIQDVDTMESTKGILCCSEHKCTVACTVAAGTQADSEEARVTQKHLLVEGGEGEKFAKQILNQIEEYKTMEDGAKDIV